MQKRYKKLTRNLKKRIKTTKRSFKRAKKAANKTLKRAYKTANKTLKRNYKTLKRRIKNAYKSLTTKGGFFAIRYRNRIDFEKIEKKLSKAKFKSIEHIAAYCRKAIMNRLKKGASGKNEDAKRKASYPGNPPKYWQNRTNNTIKKQVFYDTKQDARGRTVATVYARPGIRGDQVMQMLEKGGSQYIEVWRKTGKVDNRQYRRNPDAFGRETARQKAMGNVGYKPWHGYKPMEQRSAKEQKDIKDYYDNIVTRKKVKVRAKYKARPFVRPTVRAIIAKMPSHVKKQFNLYFR